MGKYSDHASYYNEKKEEVPSVTTIIKLLNKPFIAKWANSLGWKRQSYDKVLDERAMEGTFAHELFHEKLFKEGKEFDVSTEYRLMKAKEYLLTFEDFLNENELNPIWGEKSLSCDKYGGTIDLYCELNGKKTILDYKTSKKFYSSHFIQLGAYINLLNNHDYEVEQVAILCIRDGSYKIKIIDVNDMELYRNIFEKLSNLFYDIYELNKEWKDLM